MVVVLEEEILQIVDGILNSRPRREGEGEGEGEGCSLLSSFLI